MRFRHKTAIFIFISALLAAAVWFLPGYIEKQISEQLNISQIKDTLSRKISERTGLGVRIQGLRFDLWYGLIFTGIRLYPESQKVEKTYLVHIENLVLNISYLNLLRGKDLFPEIKLRGGKMNPYSLNFTEWTSLVKTITADNAPLNTPAGENEQSFWYRITHLENQIQNFSRPRIVAENIRISLPLRRSGSGNNPSIIKFEFESEMKENTYENTFSLLEGSENKKILEGKGKWASRNTGEIHFQYQDFPIHVMSRIFSSSSLIPHEIEESPLSMDAGTLHGKGSISLLKIGLALNMEGETRDLSVNIPDEESSIFAIKGKSSFTFNTGIDTNTGNVAFIKFSLNQKFLEIKTDYQDLSFGNSSEKNKIVSISAAATINEDKTISPVFPFLNASGEMKLKAKIKYNDKPFLFEPEGELSVSSGSFFLPEEIFKSGQPGVKNNILLVKNFSFKFGKNMSLISNGTLMNSSLSLSAVSPLKITRENDQNIYNQNWDGNFIVQDLSYQDFADSLFLLHRYILKIGGKPDAEKAEDHGPVWQFGFMRDPFYIKYIRPMTAKLSIQLQNMKNHQNTLPEALEFKIQKRDGFTGVNLTPVFSPQAQIDFYYTVEMGLSLPHHEMKLNLNLNPNPLSLYRAIQIKKPPEKLKITYGFGGDGVFAGDMVTRSWSSMLMEMDRVDLNDLEAVKIAKYVNKTDASAFQAESFSLQRSTEGPFIKFGTINMKSPQIHARGSGQYLLNSGGKMNLFFNLINENNKSGKLDINIEEDERMTPELK